MPYLTYKDLDIWKLAREIVIEVHRITLTQLPKFEMYEEGSQIRRSSKSVRSCIVEGFGRRMYKQEYLRFLSFAIASNDETRDHLETLFETGSLTDSIVYEKLLTRINDLGKKLYFFYQKVQKEHMTHD